MEHVQMGGAESQEMHKENDVHYLNFGISRAVFPKWDFELELFLLSESVPRHNGLRRCFVYLVRRKISDTYEARQGK